MHISSNITIFTFFIQALTTLDLGGNNLGALGVQLLADTLTRNTVSGIISLSVLYKKFDFFYTDTHYTRY
jgi:hypothetical protein